MPDDSAGARPAHYRQAYVYGRVVGAHTRAHYRRPMLLGLSIVRGARNVAGRVHPALSTGLLVVRSLYRTLARACLCLLGRDTALTSVVTLLELGGLLATFSDDL